MSGYTYGAERELTPREEDLLRRAKRAEALVARAERREKQAKADTKVAETKLEYVGRLARKAADADVRHVEPLTAARDRTRGLLATLRKERTTARPEDEAERARLTRELEQTRIRYTAANRDANHWQARCREEKARAQEYLQTLADVAKGGQGQTTGQVQEDQAASPEEVKAHRAEAVRLTRELAKSEEVRMAAQEALQQERESHAERLAEANRRAALAVEAQEDLQARLDGIKGHYAEARQAQTAAWRGILAHAREKQEEERAALQARLDEAEARARSLEEQAAEREDLLDEAEARARSLEVKTEYTAASDTRTYGHLVELEARVRELAGALDDALIIARDATAERDQARAKAVEHEHAALQARQQAATAAAERDRAERAARQRDEDVWETQRMIHSLDQANAPASGGATDLPPHSGNVIMAPEGTSLEDMERAWREHLAANQAKGYKLGGLIGANTEDDNQDGEQQQ